MRIRIPTNRLKNAVQHKCLSQLGAYYGDDEVEIWEGHCEAKDFPGLLDIFLRASIYELTVILDMEDWPEKPDLSEQ